LVIDAVSDAPPAAELRVCIRQRIWLEHLGEPFFGVGVRELLLRVESTGSLRHAAAEMGMAYSKAWQLVRRAEEHLGFALMSRQVGGKSGGGSIVSDEGKWLVEAFGALMREADPLLERLYTRYFGDWPRVTSDDGVAATLDDGQSLGKG
jgi:molybdate transport system regulatory protein